MGFLDRLLGRDDRAEQAAPYGDPSAVRNSGGGVQDARSERSADDVAIERYRYLLRTAPPETIEDAHAEAFAKLTPEQRRQVYTELSHQSSTGEKPLDDDARSLARSATRAELQQPGSLERGFGQRGGGMGFGGTLASSMLGTVAGFVIGSAIAQAFMPDSFDAQADGSDAGGDTGDSSAGADESGADTASADGADLGGDFGGGDFGGDFGGGDFGGDFF